MEILDLKFAGVSLWTWCAVIGIPWLLYRMYSTGRQMWYEAKERKEFVKTYVAAQKRQDEINQQIGRDMCAAIESELQKQKPQLRA
jgi:hypothetical protein